MSGQIQENIKRVKERVEKAARGRPVKIVGVTKTVPAERIVEAFHSGLQTFGENRIQEALPKIEQLASLGIEWHFIGHLQTNKSRDAVRYFSYIHSIDSLKLLKQIEKEAAKLQKKMDVMLEVNLGGEETKYGFPEAELPQAILASNDMQWAHVCGLMIIPPFFEEVEKVRPFFRRLRELRDQYRLPELSMGMSHDYIVAIEEGATLVRVGTAIFGERSVRREIG